MSTIKKYSQKLADAIGLTKNQVSFAYINANELDGIDEKLSLSDDLLEWYGFLSPINVSINTLGNPIYLYDPRILSEKQIGYRWDSDKNRLQGWDDNWVVIGDRGANPIIAHVDQEYTPISMAYHGIGNWNPKIIAPTLAKFLATLSMWADLTLNKYQINDREDYPQSFDREFKEAMLGIALSNQYIENFLEFVPTSLE